MNFYDSIGVSTAGTTEKTDTEMCRFFVFAKITNKKCQLKSQSAFFILMNISDYCLVKTDSSPKALNVIVEPLTVPLIETVIPSSDNVIETVGSLNL